METMETRRTATEHAHPQPLEYIKIAVVLSIITAIEVAIVDTPFMRPIIVPSLLILSALKFSMVVMWYMHLKFDDRLFSGLFVSMLSLAAVVLLALLALFRVFFGS